MPTFGQLKTRIAERINISNEDSKIGDAINEAISFYSHQHLWFNEATAQFTTVEDNPDLTPSPTALPADFLYEWEQGGLILTYNNRKYELQKITHSQREAIDDTNSTSQPSFYTYRLQKIYLYPIPDRAYTVDLYYIKSYDTLTTDNASNDWTNFADRLIEAKALADLYLNERHSDNKHSVYEDKAKREFDNLQKRNRKGRGTGRLKVQSLIYDVGRGGSSRTIMRDW